MLWNKAFYYNYSNGAAQLPEVEGCGWAGQLPCMQQGVAKAVLAVWNSAQKQRKQEIKTYGLNQWFAHYLYCFSLVSKQRGRKKERQYIKIQYT